MGVFVTQMVFGKTTPKEGWKKTNKLTCDVIPRKLLVISYCLTILTLSPYEKKKNEYRLTVNCGTRGWDFHVISLVLEQAAGATG